MPAIPTRGISRMSSWLARPVQGLLCDIHGVLFDNGPDGPQAIPGSVDAFNRLKSRGFPIRLVSNESSVGVRVVYERCRQLGFNVLETEIFTPVPVIMNILKEQNLRPHLLVNSQLEPDFGHFDQSNPNCLVIGDAEDNFSYHNLNEAFRLLISNPAIPFYSLGVGKYYKNTSGYFLDAGAFKVGLEYASGKKADIVGKPSKIFFDTALEALDLERCDVAMIGDDVAGDVGGSQSVGIRGVLVRTGKYLPSDMSHPSVTPDAVVDDFSQAVDALLAQ